MVKKWKLQLLTATIKKLIRVLFILSALPAAGEPARLPNWRSILKLMMRHLLASAFTLCIISLNAQTSVSSGMFGMMEARELGPGTMSGRITAIEGVVKDEGKTIFIGTAGGGVWKSTNAGASYNSKFDK